MSKLADLRARFGDLDGFLILMNDRFLSEYVPAHENRIQWLTGFTGSSASVLVLKDKAIFFTDGRYTLQAEQEVSKDYTRINIAEQSVKSWLAAHANGLKIGVDAKRISVAEHEHLRLTLCDATPMDGLWAPEIPPASSMWEYPLECAGESAEAKKTRIGRAMEADVALIASSESVNWLLNIRGHDVESTPVLHAHALLHKDGSHQLFPHARAEELQPAFAALKGKRVLVDKHTTTAAIDAMLRTAGADIVYGDDPCALPRAVKNATELDSIRTTHVKDGAALTSALSRAHSVGDEMAVDALLLAERGKQEGFLFPSFPTIAGMNAHGAIVHYRATPSSNAPITEGILLIDSGGQYKGGTTDVTRTIAIGAPTPAQKRAFTLVLKGHIALATARFPKGTTGSQLDVLARQFLWQAGMDYDHGTGHGVGNCLGVHEGPQRISKRASSVALQAGMILSNEPGYYEAGAYGIRIENLVAVVESEAGWLQFDTLTLAPIDRQLIESSMLSMQEREWLNNYHAHVFDTLSLRVAPEVATWLEHACAPI